MCIFQWSLKQFLGLKSKRISQRRGMLTIVTHCLVYGSFSLPHYKRYIIELF